MKSIAIIDYGLGNIFSIKHACEHFGMTASVTADPMEIRNAGVIILPGVGAFGQAMTDLRKLGLEHILIEEIKKGKPFIGICLGMQLLMTASREFGQHRGLGVIDGLVLPLREEMDKREGFKVPHIGWNDIAPATAGVDWEDSLLEGIGHGSSMYFVHSFYCAPADKAVVLSVSEYGGFCFASSFRKDNVYGFQFHPERSGACGTMIYRNLSEMFSRV